MKFSLAAVILVLQLTHPAYAKDLSSPEQKTQKSGETVLLLHGLGRSKSAMWRLAERLEGAGFKVHRLDYRSINNTTNDAVNDIAKQIQDCCAGEVNRLHFVGHSFGGILIRAYLQQHRLSNLGRTVMFGTPNQGSDLADRLMTNRLINYFVPIATELGTSEQSLTNQLEPPYYPVGIIAGVKSNDNNQGYLPGRNDGLVQVETTKLEGMADFIEIEVSHSGMRYNQDVANQVISFLKQGQFLHH